MKLSKRWNIVLAILIVVLGLGVLFLPRKAAAPMDVVSHRSQLSGTVVCLPHSDPNDGTKECATGLKTADGKYYALDFALLSQEQKPVGSGDKVEAWGLVTPIEMLSSDHWRKYAITGIFSVTDSLHVNE